ncbi:helix-turn-helix domain-containing protein [Dyadobacter subterraneus]|uniref:Helix-turn-helix domain-containing protein n=1 Tax=Dyadobacter subterraneus TaxID=2773304 RepID=A0ABR9WF73_9BACT|nr:helix-turn-helix domain-containing protein [Dyadobacter subterraneus]MBE9464043.1 helix-turn-helix domain-containing protein [Dyadobacter subterraneus]
MPQNPVIPLHSLSDRTNLGLEIHRIDAKKSTEVARYGAHRDDHYIFIFQKSGNIKMMIDFQEVNFEGCVIFCILPGQIHHSYTSFDSQGWFIATDLASLDDSYRAVFEDYMAHSEPVPVNEKTAEILDKSIELLFEMLGSQEDLPFQQAALRSMIQVCAGGFATVFQQHKQQHSLGNSRPVIINNAFKKMVLGNFKTIKSPAEYAEALNITPSYLNEVVKSISGFSVSYWIQREVIMEAKRLLYYTNLNIKEISFQIGYTDPTYFSRLFHKVTGSYPAAFRKEYRK